MIDSTLEVIVVTPQAQKIHGFLAARSGPADAAAAVVALDGLPCLRDATASEDVDLAAAATLAELAGVGAVRLGVSEDLKPVREEDLAEARRAVRCLELRMPPVPALLRVALDLRPDRVLLSAEGGDGRSASGPVDLRSRPQPVAASLRMLAEAGIPAGALVAADLETVKLAHGSGVSFVELHTGAIVDLPGPERMAGQRKLVTIRILRNSQSTPT